MLAPLRSHSPTAGVVAVQTATHQEIVFRTIAKIVKAPSCGTYGGSQFCQGLYFLPLSFSHWLLVQSFDGYFNHFSDLWLSGVYSFSSALECFFLPDFTYPVGSTWRSTWCMHATSWSFSLLRIEYIEPFREERKGVGGVCFGHFPQGVRLWMGWGLVNLFRLEHFPAFCCYRFRQDPIRERGWRTESASVISGTKPYFDDISAVWICKAQIGPNSFIFSLHSNKHDVERDGRDARDGCAICNIGRERVLPENSVESCESVEAQRRASLAVQRQGQLYVARARLDIRIYSMNRGDRCVELSKVVLYQA